MSTYLIEFTWFFQGESFEEYVRIPAVTLEDALICIKSVWGEVEVTYYECENNK